MRVFLVCPVRSVMPKEREAIQGYVSRIELDGNSVYWPGRDTDQTASESVICDANRTAMRAADEVHVWWHPRSEGSIFDLGMAFALRKKVALANPSDCCPTPNKSFANLVRRLGR